MEKQTSTMYTSQLPEYTARPAHKSGGPKSQMFSVSQWPVFHSMRHLVLKPLAKNGPKRFPAVYRKQLSQWTQAKQHFSVVFSPLQFNSSNALCQNGCCETHWIRNIPAQNPHHLQDRGQLLSLTGNSILIWSPPNSSHFPGYLLS